MEALLKTIVEELVEEGTELKVREAYLYLFDESDSISMI
mgnify:CR=1 FL=1